jgi:hypothetical protein
MTTFTMQDLNSIPVTKEEDEAMDALSRLGAGVPFIPEPEVSAELLHKPDINEIINAISAQLQLLATVIKENAEKGNSHADQSLQACVDATLQQAEWFKEMVEEGVETLVYDMDHSYGIESSVEDYFSNSFSLDDHVDITAEVESKVEDIAEDLLKDMVEERLAEIVSNKLQNLRITFD